MTNKIFIICIILFFISCDEDPVLLKQKCGCSVSAEDEGIQLLHSYRIKDSTMMTNFFNCWENQCLQSEGNSQGQIRDIMHHLHKSIYTIRDEYAGREYLVLQTSIPCNIVQQQDYDKITSFYPDTLGQKFNLDNFYPIPNFTNKKILYLTDKYTGALNYYINEKSTTDPHYDTTQTFEHLYDKVSFISKKILLQHQHWIAGFHYYSFPQILRVALRNDLTKAKVVIRTSYWSGEINEYEFINHSWKKIKNLVSWVE